MGVEINEEDDDGEVDDDEEDVDNEGDAFDSKLCLDICVLNRLERRRKLPLPNMSPALGCSAQ